QTVLERPVIEEGNLPCHRLGCDQAAFGLFETTEEPAQGFVDRPGQAACAKAKEAPSPITLASYRALAFAALCGPGTQAQPTSEVFLGFPGAHIGTGLRDQLHQEPVGNPSHSSYIPPTADLFEQLMKIVYLRGVLTQPFRCFGLGRVGPLFSRI